MTEENQNKTAVIKAKSSVTGGITKTKSISSKMHNEANLLGVLKKQSLFDLIWFSVFIIFGLVCIVLFHDEPLIYLTVGQLFSYLLISNLIARGRILGIWLNFFDCALYGAICFINGVYGEMFRTLVISNAFNVYGVISWRKKDKNCDPKESKSSELEVRRLSQKGLWIIVAIFAVSTVVSYFVLNAFNTTLAYLGAVVLVCSMLNKYLSMSRYLESWWVNMLGTFISTIMWTIIIVENARNGDWSSLPVLGSYFASLTNNINGMMVWNKLYRRSTVNGGEYLAMREIKINRITKVKRTFKRLKWIESRDYVPPCATENLEQRIKVATNRGLYH